MDGLLPKGCLAYCFKKKTICSITLRWAMNHVNSGDCVKGVNTATIAHYRADHYLPPAPLYV